MVTLATNDDGNKFINNDLMCQHLTRISSVIGKIWQSTCTHVHKWYLQLSRFSNTSSLKLDIILSKEYGDTGSCFFQSYQHCLVQRFCFANDHFWLFTTLFCLCQLGLSTLIQVFFFFPTRFATKKSCLYHLLFEEVIPSTALASAIACQNGRCWGRWLWEVCIFNWRLLIRGLIRQ